MSEELKPCPFCGSNDIDPEGWMRSANNKYNDDYVTGPACNGNSCLGSADSVEDWNTRPIEDALREENEIMRKALQKLSTLGNGEQPGNSTGNVMAQDALRKVDKD